MFSRLFAESGLSLDRLRALVEVGASGSIVRAVGNDPVRQSQYSRQIKELEDFFQTGLVERHGKGIRLTGAGRELARISRFFLMGLSNFQRGCRARGQTYRLGASPTFIRCFVLPVLADLGLMQAGIQLGVESAPEDEVERKLQEFTMDFGVVTREVLSRPLQLQELGHWGVGCWVPRQLYRSETQAGRALLSGRLPLAWPAELPRSAFPELGRLEPSLSCQDFLHALAALQSGITAAILPTYLNLAALARKVRHVRVAEVETRQFRYYLASNPRLLRLNPHSRRRRDTLATALAKRLAGSQIAVASL